MDGVYPRRTWLQAAGVAGLAGLAEATLAAAEDRGEGRGRRGGIKLGEPAVVTPQVMKKGTIGQNVSDDGLAATVLFDSLTASLDPQKGKKGSRSVQKIGVVEIPVTANNPEHLIGFYGIIRGFVDKPKKTRATVTVEFGSTITVIEFPVGEELNADYQRQFFSLIPPVETVDGDNQARKPVIFPYLTATFLLSIQSGSAEEGANLTVDSLNIETVILHQHDHPKPPQDN